MIFMTNIQGTPSWQLVLEGKKTCSFRPNGDRYKVGKTYAVQPGRGKKAVGRISVTKVEQTTPHQMPHDDIRAEGFTIGVLGSYCKFIHTLSALYPGLTGKELAHMPGFAVHFELVKEAPDGKK